MTNRASLIGRAYARRHRRRIELEDGSELTAGRLHDMAEAATTRIINTPEKRANAKALITALQQGKPPCKS